MAKIRVYELARELNIESKLLVTRIREMGIEVASHQSTLLDKDITTIRARLGGGTETDATMQGADKTNAAGDSSPTVVLRRRKRVVDSTEQDEQGQDASSSKQILEVTTTELVSDPRGATARSTAASSPVLRRRVTKVENPEDFQVMPDNITPTEPSPDAMPAVEASSSAEVVTDPATASTMARKVEAVRPDAPVPESFEAKVETLGALASAPSPSSPVADPAQSALAARRSRPEFASATVIRRATPEERIELQKEMQQQTTTAAGGAQSVRQEDSRGTRITGMTYPGKGPDEPPPIDEFGVVNRKGIKKTKAVEEKEEAEAIAKKRAALKGRKQHLSTRDLLAVTIDEIVDEDQEDIAVIAPIVGPRARTVYTPSSGGSKRNLKRRKDLKQTQITTPRAAYRVVKMGAIITVAELAKQMSVKATELIKKLMTQGEMVTINSNIDFDTASLLATDYGFELKDTSTDITDIIKTKALSDYKASELVSRPPIVTVMGHVDHGKTSILDAIRQTKVASGEAGGITQHIGAYMVEKNGKKISFLDTPGHEAFSNMRARGAKVTDIVVLVVAADDGVMPQTLESIAHAREAEVPIIVAINKIDKPNVNFDRIYNELAAHGVQSEEWGGDTQFVKVSALQRLGIDDLLESVLLQAEVLDLKAFEAAPVEGRVIEAHLDKGRGPVSTIMVQNGTLRVGDFVVAGSEYGKVRAMYNHAGVSLVSAGPSTPAQVIGLSGVPASGDPVNAVEDEKTAKSAAEWRQAVSSSVYKSSAAKMDDFLSRIKSDGEIELPLIVKADTHGSIEAIVDAILKLNDNKKNIRNKIIHKGVGGITGSDISLAATSGAFILAFNVRAGKILEEDAERSGVPLKYFGIIYDIVDAVKALMAGKLPPIQSESILGRAQVKQPITVPKIGTVAGSSVIDGKITRNSFLRLIRDDVVIYDGKLKSLRRFKDDVKEVATGYECGISIEGYNDIKEGDVIEAYIIEETPATLDM